MFLRPVIALKPCSFHISFVCLNVKMLNKLKPKPAGENWPFPSSQLCSITPPNFQLVVNTNFQDFISKPFNNLLACHVELLLTPAITNRHPKHHSGLWDSINDYLLDKDQAAATSKTPPVNKRLLFSGESLKNLYFLYFFSYVNCVCFTLFHP